MRQRYAAFLSYSHHDRAAARRLQAWLEAYRVPEALVGAPGAYGPIPPRIRPVFRDEADMGASGDLADSVADALAQSDALVVLCSPAAARSVWVAEEVRRFKARAGGSRVFALAIAGAPWAGDGDGDATLECLPLPLRRAVSPDGAVGDESAEPLVADARGAGGLHAARMRVAAGLLGAPLDALVHREHGRRTRRLLGLAAVLALALALTGALALAAFRARDAARLEREKAEARVGFMLGDLRGRLDALGRLDLMDAVASQTLGYFREQSPDALRPESLAQRAKAQRLVGELRMARGDLPAAERAFADAAATTGELARRDPNDGARLFDHAQSVFWQGAIAYERGDTRAARPRFEEYARLADRLVALDPERADWRAEIAHSRVNLGGLRLAERDAGAAAALFRQAAAAFRDARARDPGAASEQDHARALAWLADADRLAGDLDGARAAREEELRLHLGLLRADPEDARALVGVGLARYALSEIALDTGDARTAVAHARQATALWQRLRRLEPQQRRWTQVSVLSERQLGMALFASGQVAEAAVVLDRAIVGARAVRDLEPDALGTGRLLGSTLVARAEVARALSGEASALAFARQAAIVMPPPEPESGDALAWWARLRLALGNDGAPSATSEVARALMDRPGARSLIEECLLVQAAGPEAAGARDAQARIAQTGYRNPRCGPAARTAAL